MLWRPAPDALRPGSDIATENAGCGGWRKTQVGQGVIHREREPWKLLRGGKGEERSPVNGVCVEVETVSVRSDPAGRPEHVEAAVPLPMFSSYAAVVLKQPERCLRSNRSVKKLRSVSAAPPESEGVGGSGNAVLFLAATSSNLFLWLGCLVKRTVRFK